MEEFQSAAGPDRVALLPFTYQHVIMLSPEVKPKLLLVEDDVNLGYLLRENLTGSGYQVLLTTTGRESLRAINEQCFDLCLLDVMLPESDGFSIAIQLRRIMPAVPFLFITARSQEVDRIRGFELGAEDYVLKPFSMRELECRLDVILRRHKSAEHKKTELDLHIGNLALYVEQRKLVSRGVERKLSQRETGLLQLLLQHQGTYVSRSDILKQLWGSDDYFTARSMDVYLTRIRKLLREQPELEIENLYGSGYRIRLKQ